MQLLNAPPKALAKLGEDESPRGRYQVGSLNEKAAEKLGISLKAADTLGLPVAKAPKLSPKRVDREDSDDRYTQSLIELPDEKPPVETKSPLAQTAPVISWVRSSERRLRGSPPLDDDSHSFEPSEGEDPLYFQEDDPNSLSMASGEGSVEALPVPNTILDISLSPIPKVPAALVDSRTQSPVEYADDSELRDIQKKLSLVRALQEKYGLQQESKEEVNRMSTMTADELWHYELEKYLQESLPHEKAPSEEHSSLHEFRRSTRVFDSQMLELLGSHLGDSTDDMSLHALRRASILAYVQSDEALIKQSPRSKLRGYLNFFPKWFNAAKKELPEYMSPIPGRKDVVVFTMGNWDSDSDAEEN